MEVAACFAVAAFRGLPFGQLLYAGDDLSGEQWDERGWVRHASGREMLFRLAAESVLRPSPAAGRFVARRLAPARLTGAPPALGRRRQPVKATRRRS
jgi:hypothetical protein